MVFCHMSLLFSKALQLKLQHTVTMFSSMLSFTHGDSQLIAPKPRPQTLGFPHYGPKRHAKTISSPSCCYISEHYSQVVN